MCVNVAPRRSASLAGKNETGEVSERGLTVDHEHCAACGFDGSEYESAALLAAIRALGPRWKRLLIHAGDDLRRRPAPQTWSALEYAAHSRDITALHAFGVEEALTIDEPMFPQLDGDAARRERLRGLRRARPRRCRGGARRCGSKTGRFGPGIRACLMVRGITFGSTRRDVRSLLEHALHDSHHHLIDVENGLADLRAKSS